MKRLFLVLAVLAVVAVIPRVSPVDARDDVQLWRCGTELSQADVDEFKARELRPRTGFIPQGQMAPPYCIPIVAHIVRRTNGTGGLSLAQLDQGIADANVLYQNTGMVFQLLSVDYIDDDDYFFNINTTAEIDALLGENVVADAVNAYFTPNLSNEGGGLCGRGSFTTSTPQGIAMNNGCMGTSDNTSSFPHELGHFFDLFHTHETAFGAELVDGSNCGTAGDKLCDTPADPTLDPGTNVTVFPGCVYNGSETDGNGDSYSPDTHQMMSYSDKNCRDTMSPQSEAKVVATLLNERPELLNKGCAPAANAGTDILAECAGSSTSVQLDGTGSSDPEGASLTYAWAATGITFDDATSSQPTGGFPFGTTVVTLTVSDGTYTRTDEVNVTVDDTTPPTITCPSDITVECESHCGTPATNPTIAAFLADVSATDVCEGAIATIENDAPDCFEEGQTVVTFSTEDSQGNPVTCQATVTVEDTTPPEITVDLNRYSLWPPNHKLVEICATVTVTDICDDDATFVLQEITCDEPVNDIGDGNTEPDIQNADYETADLCFDLRSERQGGGDGRVYTIVYRAEDGAGNESVASVQVRVAHDQSAHAMAATGFGPGGEKLIGQRFALVIPGSREMVAAELDPARIFVGNTRDAVRPLSHRVVDVNQDGLADLAVEFLSAAAMSCLPTAINIDPETGALLGVNDGPVGLHFTTPAGTDFLVTDIFALGNPVKIPTIATPRPQGEEIAVAPPTKTGFKSVHPNPFNPQTSVTFTLSAPEHVRIAIYDVRGTLVRRLTDQAMPVGEHSIVWNGADDAGRTASSGIYFVRLLAGRVTETRKIVMLK